MLHHRDATTLTLRAAALAFVVLHVGASAVFPALDAVLEAEVVGAGLHVESPGNEDCATHHDHLFCQVVRSLSSTQRVSTPLAVQPGALAVVEVALGDAGTDATRSALLPGSAHPRAPPLA